MKSRKKTKHCAYTCGCAYRHVYTCTVYTVHVFENESGGRNVMQNDKKEMSCERYRAVYLTG